jgi:hypothetical protein
MRVTSSDARGCSGRKAAAARPTSRLSEPDGVNRRADWSSNAKKCHKAFGFQVGYHIGRSHVAAGAQMLASYDEDVAAGRARGRALAKLRSSVNLDRQAFRRTSLEDVG